MKRKMLIAYPFYTLLIAYPFVAIGRPMNFAEIRQLLLNFAPQGLFGWRSVSKHGSQLKRAQIREHS